MSYLPATLCLMNETITTAQTASTKTAVAGLARARSVALECIFTYGSSGTTAKAWVQTSFDNGTTWVDIACFDHATTSLSRIYNLSAMTPLTTVYTALDGSMSADTCKDGILGDQLRVKFTSTGTYAGTTTMKIYAVLRGS